MDDDDNSGCDLEFTRFPIYSNSNRFKVEMLETIQTPFLELNVLLLLFNLNMLYIAKNTQLLFVACDHI